MEKNSRLNITEVTSLARRLCDAVNGEQHEVITVGVSLEDRGELKDYITYLICPVDEISQAIADVERMNGLNVEDYFVNPDYCHICTYENNLHSISQISFDLSDEFPIKARINSEYNYVDTFFRRYLQYHDILHNDIEEYFSTVTLEYQADNTSKKYRK